ncbi:MAG: efflux RND transporter periplasmic adaptor subunit [Tannerella sp.]|jgi:RND family efflux transporter MFP subunit|nr:efflux RND transporter periplasmic adaptor subunit [Tannerella sp.]
MKRKNIFKGIALLAVGALTACGGNREQAANETAAAETADTRVKVHTTVARLQTVDDVSTYTGNVQADVINHITPTMPGRIERIYVEIGDRVTKDQLLVQMESSNLQQQTTQLANLERDYERYSALLEVGGIAQQQVDQIRTQIDVLKAAIKNLQDNTQLRSPISGVVTARNYDNGNVFAQQPILTVQQLNLLKVIINVSESYFTKVRVGMKVDIRLDVYGSEVFAGRVSLIYPTVDASSHTFGVEVAIDNRDMKVRPGMYARVTLNFGTGESIVVPDVAVQKQAGANDKYVFVVQNGVARYRRVEPGQRLDEQCEILSGIEPGDEVVTAGHTRLIDGAAVQVIQ